MRRALRYLAVLLALSACSSSGEDYAQIQAIVTPNAAPADPRIQALVDAGAPRLQVAFPETDRAGVMLREARRDGLDTWLSLDGGSLVTQQGMLRGTRGFGAGLLTSDIEQSRQLVLAGRAGIADRFHSYLTGNDETRTRTYRCTIKNRGARVVTIQGVATASTLMAEDCRNLNQSFLNLYWVARNSGRIVQTRQWTGEFLGNISTRVIAP